MLTRMMRKLLHTTRCTVVMERRKEAQTALRCRRIRRRIELVLTP